MTHEIAVSPILICWERIDSCLWEALFHISELRRSGEHLLIASDAFVLALVCGRVFVVHWAQAHPAVSIGGFLIAHGNELVYTLSDHWLEIRILILLVSQSYELYRFLDFLYCDGMITLIPDSLKWRSCLVIVWSRIMIILCFLITAEWSLFNALVILNRGVRPLSPLYALNSFTLWILEFRWELKILLITRLASLMKNCSFILLLVLI